MKKSLSKKIVLLVLLIFVQIFIQGCKPKVNKHNNEVNAIIYFINVTKDLGETQIEEFRKYDYDKDTIYYYVKWKLMSGEGTDDKEHLIVFEVPILKSVLYPISRIDDYPAIKNTWDILNEKNDFTAFSKDEVDKFIEIAHTIRRP